MLLEATRQKLPPQAALAPEIAIFSYEVLLSFAVTAFLSRATLRRILGAVAGGVLFGLFWLLRWRIGYAMGWWRTAFPETPDPTALFTASVMPLLIILVGAALLIISWRIARRFGWLGCSVFILAVAASGAIRDRIYWDSIMRVLVATPGILPVAVDGAFFVAGLALGHGLMRLIAGPAPQDALARTR